MNANNELLRAAKALLRYAERNECSHEETHRGGAIWTICDDCGRKWADDEGGFKPYQEPKEIAEARAAIAAAEQAQPSEPEHVTCNDPFAFRCGERIHLRTSGVDRDDRLAFMCAPVPPLLDPACKQSFRGPPVENYCVVGAELVNGKWQWLRIAPDTKELIGDLLFDHGLERGKWYGAIITSGGAS